MTAPDQQTLLFVAIDFGTTFSGYAFKFKKQEEQKEKIFVNNNWEHGLGFKSYKVPTCVLTDVKDNFKAFGFEAQEQYNTNIDDDSDWSDDEDSNDKKKKPVKQKPILHYYDEFKMMLKGEKTLNRDMKLKALDGHECTAMKIFAMALRFLKDHLLHAIGKHSETFPKQDEIRWVLTVPAIWSDSAKQFMRECAKEAGIVDSEASDQLLIALESEAASLYCRTLDLREFKLKENVQVTNEEIKRSPKNSKKEGLPKDSHYLVVDCGGGTVDVTAHHYKENGDICELYAASARGWGGGNVNKQFEQKLNEVIAPNIMETYKLKLPPAYLNDKIQFERQKRNFDFLQETLSYYFKCSYSFIQLCVHENYGKKIKDILEENQKIKDINEINEQHIKFSNGNLKFSRKALLDMFSPSVTLIRNYVLGLIDRDELKKVGYIYFVGGFSDCSLLQKVMKEEFAQGPYKHKKIQVILAPYEASLAVVKGAVLFGTNPHAITSRRSRRFYCTLKTGSSRGRKILEPIVKQNEEIYNDDVRHAHFSPYHDGNTFRLYHYKLHSFTKSLKYYLDKDVESIDIDLSKIVGINCTADTKITLYMYFDSTEIHVTARNDKSHDSKQVNVSIDCLAL